MVRIFWSAVAILIAATAAVFFLPAKPAQTPRQSVANPVSLPDAAPNPGELPIPSVGATPAAAPPGPATLGAASLEADSVPPAINLDIPSQEIELKLDETAESKPINPRSDMPNPDLIELPDPNDPLSIPLPGEPISAEAAPITEPVDEVQPAGSAQAESGEPDATDAATKPQDIPTPDIDSVADEAPADETSTPIDDPTQEQAEDEAAETQIAEDNAEEIQNPTNDQAGASDEIDDQSGQPAPPIAVTPRRSPEPVTEPKEKADPVVQTPTGLLLDGRWQVEGKGTKSNPYEIDWDMLVAVQREYQPRLGQATIPEWINALNGKTVTIRGYALLPMGMSSMSELLVMLNQWDSCCIGVPPTPFDAIEVRLEKDLTASAQSMFSHTGALSFGDITGTFKVDPYIVQGYLLGLYLMEDASANLLGPAGTP